MQHAHISKEKVTYQNNTKQLHILYFNIDNTIHLDDTTVTENAVYR